MEFDRFDPVHEPRIGGNAELVAQPADEVEPERMEGADPHRDGMVGFLGGDPFGHLACGLVRIGQDEDTARINAFFEELNHARGERLGLAGAGAGLEQIGLAAMVGRGGLLVVQRFLDTYLVLGLNGGKEERIEQLLDHHVERGVHALGDVGGGEPVLEMKPAQQRARQQQFAREQIHLDLASLPSAIIDDSVDAGGRGFGGARHVGAERGGRNARIAELMMADLMGDEKSLLEERADIFMDDEIVDCDQGCSAAIELGGAGAGGLNLQPAMLRFPDREAIGIGRVEPARDCSYV